MTPIIRIQLAACLVLLLCNVSYSAEKKQAPKKPDGNDYCASCHEGLAQAPLKEPVGQWKASVHDGEGKKCSLCHGGDPGVNDRLRAKSRLANYIGRPDKKRVPEFCGREGCHTVELEQFRGGPHYLSVQKSGEPGCVYCHGSHDVRKASTDSINIKSCSACHPADRAKEMVEVIRKLDRSIAEIDGGIQTLKDKRMDVAQMEERLGNTRRQFSLLVHSFSRNELENSKKSIDVDLRSLKDESRSKVASVQRLDILYITMVSLALVIIGGMIFYIIIMYSRRKK